MQTTVQNPDGSIQTDVQENVIDESRQIPEVVPIQNRQILPGILRFER